MQSGGALFGKASLTLRRCILQRELRDNWRLFTTNKMESSTQNKVLLAFDFDHTLIDNNCDTYINKLAPGHKIPDNLKNLYRTDGWTHYMGEVFKYLHGSGVSKEDILSCLREIKLTEGMRELLTGVPRENTEFIVISDANFIFIDSILRNVGFRDLFRTLFTNPAEFDDSGCLHIQMYHLQDWCNLSTKNLCKGSILTNYIRSREEESNVSFSTIAYVGDGMNDFCPSLLLKDCDIVFPRCGYSLLNVIPKMEAEKGLKLEADVCPWDSGKDILERLLLCYQNQKHHEIPRPRLKDQLKKDEIEK